MTKHEDATPGEPLALRLSEGLGPNAPLLDRLRSTAHWQLTEGNGDDATHQALQEAIAEIERLMWYSGELRGCIAQMERDEERRYLALGPNVELSGHQRPAQE